MRPTSSSAKVERRLAPVSFFTDGSSPRLTVALGCSRRRNLRELRVKMNFAKPFPGIVEDATGHTHNQAREQCSPLIGLSVWFYAGDHDDVRKVLRVMQPHTLRARTVQCEYLIDRDRFIVEFCYIR